MTKVYRVTAQITDTYGNTLCITEKVCALNRGAACEWFSTQVPRAIPHATIDKVKARAVFGGRGQ